MEHIHAHHLGCVADKDQNLRWETSANAAAGTMYRSYSRVICASCGAATKWERTDQWRHDYPDEQ